MEKKNKLNTITGIVLAGFIVAVIYHYILGNVFNLGYPHNTFLFFPKARFSDFTDFYRVFKDGLFTPYVQNWYPGVNYFPFGELVPYLFTLLPVLGSFILFNIITIGYFIFYNFKNISSVLNNKINIFFCFFVMTFLSYPFLLLLDRANFDLLIFIFTALFIHFFIKEKYTVSSLLLAFSIAMKGFAIVFIPLLLAKKKFKELFYCFLTVLILTVSSLLYTQHSFSENYRYFSEHMLYYKNNYIIGNAGMWGSSLFGIVKFIIFSLNGCFETITHNAANFSLQFKSFLYSCNLSVNDYVINSLKIFMPISILLALLTAFYAVFIEKVFWRQLLVLCLCSIIFSPVTGDGKLLNLFIPLYLFINCENKTKNDLFYAVLFGLILIPKNYVQFIHNSGNVSLHFNSSALINPLIMLIMLLIIVVEGFIKQKSKDGELNLERKELSKMPNLQQ